MFAKAAIHVAEVGVHVVGVPVQRVVLGAQVVAREVPARVAQAVELVPEQTPGPHRDRDHASTGNVVGLIRQLAFASTRCSAPIH